MKLRLLSGAELVAGLAEALAGGPPVAPVPPARLLPVLQPEQPVTEPDAAVVVTTSGSTGEPKAVVLTRSAITFATGAAHQRLGGAGDWVCALPAEHVAGLMTIARPLVAGTGIAFARPDLTDLPTPGRRTYLSLVPAQLDRALDQPGLAERLAGYAAVVVGGSALPAGLAERAAAAGVRVVASYGMSETCGGCVYDGVPLDGVRVELDGERVGLGGPMAFAGYRLRPDLTAAVLAGDLVRTNDRGRWHDGRLQVLGRSDEIVITGGHNVDLAAGQRVLDAAFGPATVGLLAVPDPRWGQRIVAVTTTDLSLAAVQDRVRAELGEAAQPRELRRVPTLAYTSIGKIDRAALLRSWQE